jgi:hypothetical protein
MKDGIGTIVIYGISSDTNTINNKPLNNWNTSNVTTMKSMFSSATNFNQDISNVNNIGTMFFFANAFNQNISKWCPKVSVNHNVFENSPLIPSYYQKANNWSSTDFTNGYYNSPTP